MNFEVANIIFFFSLYSMLLLIGGVVVEILLKVLFKTIEGISIALTNYISSNRIVLVLELVFLFCSIAILSIALVNRKLSILQGIIILFSLIISNSLGIVNRQGKYEGLLFKYYKKARALSIKGNYYARTLPRFLIEFLMFTFKNCAVFCLIAPTIVFFESTDTAVGFFYLFFLISPISLVVFIYYIKDSPRRKADLNRYLEIVVQTD